jgi:hypothetical protein
LQLADNLNVLFLSCIDKKGYPKQALAAFRQRKTEASPPEINPTMNYKGQQENHQIKTKSNQHHLKTGMLVPLVL